MGVRPLKNKSGGAVDFKTFGSQEREVGSEQKRESHGQWGA